MISLNVWNLLFIVINILILFIAMKKFFFKPVQDIIAKRQEEADEQFEKAGEQRACAEALKLQYEQSVKDMENEKKAVMSEARSNADAEYRRIIADAAREAEQLKQIAKEEAKQQKSQILKSAEKEIADFVVDAAAKIAGNSNGAESDSALYSKFIDKAGDKRDAV